MGQYDFKRIADPVYKTIELSEVETEVINTPTFQRLRNIKHLGLVNYVFPGGDFSRFEHSLGVCHITGQILNALQKQDTTLDDNEIQQYRLAGLLHDIGHYPFSHPFEYAGDNFYKVSLFDKNKEAGVGEARPRMFRHERVGKEILLNDTDINSVLKRYSYKPELISSIFMREERRYSNLVSSDLDADRIDSLLRTAHHTGVPYGSIDFDYILNNMKIDASKRICIGERALRTADHLLLCRYFVYQQIIFHKTVVAFELLLKDVLGILLEEKLLECHDDWVVDQIKTGNWKDFDDSIIMGKMKNSLNKIGEDNSKFKIESILKRQPPKLVYEDEFLGKRSGDSLELFRTNKKIITSKIKDWSEQFSIDENLWFFESIPGMVLTSVGSVVPISSAMEEKSDQEIDKYEQSVWVLRQEFGDSWSIMADKRSVMRELANSALYSLRIFVLFPEGTEKEKREEVESRIKQDLSFD